MIPLKTVNDLINKLASKPPVPALISIIAFFLSGVQSEKVFTNDMIDKVVREVEKKASELDNSK